MKKTYIKFEMDHCMPCKFSQQMLVSEYPELEEQELIKEINSLEEAEVGKLNVFNITQSPEALGEKFNVTGVPTFITLDEQGEVVSRFSGMDNAKLKALGNEITQK